MAQIMIVDRADEEREAIAAALQSIPGVEIQQCPNAVDAAQALFEHPVELVLVDVSTAADAEWMLLDHLKREHPKLPTVLLTTEGGPQEATVRALRMGAASFIPKSALAQDLVVTVERLLTMSGCRRNHSRLKDCLSHSGSRFVIEGNDQSLVPVLASRLVEIAEDFGILRNGKRMQLGVAIEEALNNAIVHGNLEISSRLKEEEGNAFFDAVRERLAQEPYAQRQVRVDSEFTDTECRIRIRDEGPGFDPNDVPNPTHVDHLDRPYGRGLFLIRAFTDEVSFNDAGNEITLVKRKDHGEAKALSP